MPRPKTPPSPVAQPAREGPAASRPTQSMSTAGAEATLAAAARHVAAARLRTAGPSHFATAVCRPHLSVTEPLAVHAFTRCVARAPNGSLVIDVGSNAGAYAVIAAALGARVLTIEHATGVCGNGAVQRGHQSDGRAGGRAAGIRYEQGEDGGGRGCGDGGEDGGGGGGGSSGGSSGGDGGAPRAIAVPDDECSTMVSPSAVGGRYPNGPVTRKTRIILGVDSTHLLDSAMRLVWVPSMALGLPPSAPSVAQRMAMLSPPSRPIPGGSSRVSVSTVIIIFIHVPSPAAISVIKIDVEGFEIRVLDSLRPAWGRLGDILLEVQPRAGALPAWPSSTPRTLHELMRARAYVAITLPHRDDDAAASVAGWELCGVPPPARGRPRVDTPLEQGRVQHVDTPRARRPPGVRRRWQTRCSSAGSGRSC